MRSIRYVVEKYGGLMSFQTEDGIFHLNLCIPVPEEPALTVDIIFVLRTCAQ